MFHNRASNTDAAVRRSFNSAEQNTLLIPTTWVASRTSKIKQDRTLGFQKVEVPRISRQSAHEGGNVVTPTQRPPLHPRQEIALVLISVRGWVNPRAIVRPKGWSQWQIPPSTSIITSCRLHVPVPVATGLWLRSEWPRIRPYFYTDVYGRRRTAVSSGHTAFSYGCVQVYSVQISCIFRIA